ncbi:MAG: 1-acyl-sn-glycerol-3-phosphate acyltransferase [Bdellovibrionales bacterium]|nr:1-acyl-sn-glycerol-3-phosphate acyltransferase [Bdellovibrionales bacterium]
MGHAKYKFFRALVQGILNLYYRSIEVYGKNFVPRNGRTLFIANHQAGLVDGILVVAVIDKPVRTLAKHTLWDNPVIGLFASALRMIPVKRKQDTSGELAKLSPSERNKQMFGDVEQSFVDGEFVLLFPEGRSHDGPQMLRLRSGASRMLLQTEAAHDFRLGLKWIPVSLDFEKREQPGTRLLLHFHPARGVHHHKKMYEQDSEAAVEALRSEMETTLREVTVNFATWEDRVFIERLTEVWLAEAQGDQLLERHNFLLKWKRILENTATDDPELWKQLQTSVKELYSSLNLLGLKPSDIYRRSPRSRRRLAFRVLFRVFLWGPAIAGGLIFWWAPTALIRWVAGKWATSKDVIPSYKIVAGVIAYPLWLLLVFPWVASMLGQTAALGHFILAISTGIAALMVARRLRPEIREVLSLYKYGSVKNVVGSTDQQIRNIWTQAARLWNRGLRRQILIETLSSAEEEKLPKAS